MFLPTFIRLLGSVALEGAFNISSLLISLLPWRKNSMRKKMSAIMNRSTGRLPVLLGLCLALSAGALFSGCSSCGSRQKSLFADMNQTFSLLRETTSATEEISYDLGILFDPEWGELSSTFNHLRETNTFSEEVAFDLGIFFDPEWDQFMDTICRFAR